MWEAAGWEWLSPSDPAVFAFQEKTCSADRGITPGSEILHIYPIFCSHNLKFEGLDPFLSSLQALFHMEQLIPEVALGGLWDWGFFKALLLFSPPCGRFPDLPADLHVQTTPKGVCSVTCGSSSLGPSSVLLVLLVLPWH